jgi:hypothetical protein
VEATNPMPEVAEQLEDMLVNIAECHAVMIIRDC